MKACGIICEYNPFHKGHTYHITRTKEMLKLPIVCVMSGNYVQRGDIAVMNKHARAECALRNGADLVLELPTIFSCASSQRFARGAVQILSGLGITEYLSFGSEDGDCSRLIEAARLAEQAEAGEEIKKYISEGMSYPSARAAAAEKIDPQIASILDTPNNILAVDYIRELERSGGNIKPFTVKRIGADHDSVSEDEGFASATYIRGLIKKGDYESAFTFMPESAKEIFIQEIGRGTAPVHIENLDTAVMSKLRTMTPDDYFILPDVSEGLENRLYKASRDSVTLEDCAMAAKTKRYTLSRLRRIYMCAYLGIKADDYERHVPYVRALGFNDTGRKLLTEIRENVPVIIKPAGILDKEFNEEIRAQFEREALFTDLYSLAYPALMKRLAGNEFRQSPTYLL